MKTPITLVVLVAFTVWSTGGCTAALWEDAGHTRMDGPQVWGVEAGPAGARAVVGYGVGGADQSTRRFEVAVPLGPDGLPPAPFAYRGRGRTVAAILADVGDGQRRAIGAAVLPAIGRDKGWVGPAGTAAGWHWSPTYYDGSRCDDEGRVAVVILTRDAGRQWPTRDADGRAVKLGAVAVGAEETVVLLPASQPRPAGDLARSRAVAVALTPVTVAGDLMLFPLAGALMMVILLTGGSRC